MYDSHSPPPTPPRRRRGRGLVYFLILVAVVAVGVTTYVLVNRLSDDVLTVIATIGCAAGVALPGLLLGLVILLRRAEGNGKQQAQQQQPMMTQPQLMVIPPMAIPPQQTGQPPATWDTTPGPRHFTVVGEQGDDERW